MIPSRTTMSCLRGPDRSEVQLLPPCLDDYVAANAPARFIDAYAEGLDVASLGFTHARPKNTGRLKVPSLSRGRRIILRICPSSASAATCTASAAAGGWRRRRRAISKRSGCCAGCARNSASARSPAPRQALGLRQPAPGAQPAQRRATPRRAGATRRALKLEVPIRKVPRLGTHSPATPEGRSPKKNPNGLGSVLPASESKPSQARQEFSHSL